MIRRIAKVTALIAAGFALASTGFAGQPLPMNPGLIDAMQPAAPRRAETLSLTELEERVRATKAIPTLQKLRLKSEIDDLRERFERAHASGQPDLDSLRDPYEKLMAKLQGLLRKDRQLQQDVAASKERIWDVLADRTQFAALN
jgi:hypothetical protein